MRIWSIFLIKYDLSLMSWEVTVARGSECHLKFVRGKLQIAEKTPTSTIKLSE